MIEIDSDTIEGRLLRILLEEKPVTVKELARELHLSEKKLERVVKALISRGIIQTEGTGDKVYVRLIRKDISFHGINPAQEKALKHKREKKKNRTRDDRSNDMMYG